MSPSQRQLLERYYPEVRTQGYTHVDGTVAFYRGVHERLRPGAIVVDFGCGRGARLEDDVAERRDLQLLRGKAEQVIGLDVDAAGEANPGVDQFHLLDGSRWPLDDASADLVLCDWVLEHLEDPEQFFRESSRVLRAGGSVCIRTSNRWSYVSLVARLIPESLHSGVLRKAQPDRSERDVFPAAYGCNTIRALRGALRRHGFLPKVRGHESEPGYLAFSPLAYRLGVWWQRFAPRAFATTILGFGRKAGGTQPERISS